MKLTLPEKMLIAGLLLFVLMIVTIAISAR